MVWAVGFAVILTAPLACAKGPSPGALHLFKEMGVRIVRRFPTGVGVEGYVIQSGMHRALVYTVGGGRALLFGRLINAKGRNLSGYFIDRYLVRGGVWKRLASSPWIAEGAAHPRTIVYALVDPNCVYCHHFWEWVQPYFKKGLQVRYLMVAVLAPSSLGKAARVLQSRNPARAYNQMEEAYAHGGLAPLARSQIDPKTYAKIRNVTLLFSWLGFRGTPAIIVRGIHGGLHLTSGVPPQADLPSLLGLAPGP
ncbi:MAG: thiol:disulfide interchange protein DsbG [Gammaproteobacteria bacterium]